MAASASVNWRAETSYFGSSLPVYGSEYPKSCSGRTAGRCVVSGLSEVPREPPNDCAIDVSLADDPMVDEEDYIRVDDKTYDLFACSFVQSSDSEGSQFLTS